MSKENLVPESASRFYEVYITTNDEECQVFALDQIVQFEVSRRDNRLYIEGLNGVLNTLLFDYLSSNQQISEIRVRSNFWDIETGETFTKTFLILRNPRVDYFGFQTIADEITQIRFEFSIPIPIDIKNK